jgi:hypothetical protein
MEITLTEALRIKNEISNTIKTLSYSIHQSLLGVTTEDGQVTSQDIDTFIDVENSLINALAYSEEINNSISIFNKESHVDSTVRKMQNAKLLLDIYNRNLSRTKPKTQKKFENLGTVRQSIEVVYAPLLSSKEMKERISTQKNLVRNLQKEVEAANQQKINVSFSYKDIENLTL